MAEVTSPDEEGEEPDEATLAFEALRAEIVGMRCAIEALGPALQDVRSSAPDYSPTLGVLAKNLHAMAQRVEAIEKHTAAKLSPEAYAREMGRARDTVLRPFRDGLESARREVIEAAVSLRDAVGAVREKEEQGRRLLWTAMGGAAAGLVAFPLLVFPIARWLPGMSERLALSALGRNGWEAGSRLMETDSPTSWRRLVEADGVVRVAGDELRACREAAMKAGKDQRCTITVRPPSAP